MATFSAKKSTREVITAKEYLRRRSKDPKSVEGARVVTPNLGSRRFGMFEVEREIPLYEVFPQKV